MKLSLARAREIAAPGWFGVAKDADRIVVTCQVEGCAYVAAFDPEPRQVLNDPRKPRKGFHEVPASYLLAQSVSTHRQGHQER